MTLPEELEELRDKKIWLCYTFHPVPGTSKPTKPPVSALTLRNCSVGDADGDDNLTTFDKAAECIGKTATVYAGGKSYRETVEGVGLVLHAAGLIGIDLDHVIQLDDNGKEFMDPEAKGLIKSINSYTERSPSRDGVHILARGDEIDSGLKFTNANGSVYEMYSNSRYFTFTGDYFKRCGGIADRPEKLKQFEKLLLLRKNKKALSVAAQPKTGSGERVTVTDTNAELWEKMFNSIKGAAIRRLYDGDTSDYFNPKTGEDDDSSAALGLCNHLAYWTNCDAARIDEMFRESELINNPDISKKWDRKYKSSDTRTWGDVTIAKALEGRTPFCGFTAAEKKAYARKKSLEEDFAE